MVSDVLLVGKKNIAAFEFRIDSANTAILGGVVFWIGGAAIGTLSDVSVLPSIAFQFCDLDECMPDGSRLAGMSPEEAYDVIQSGSVGDVWDYVFSPGGGFDDFSIFVYTIEDYLVFTWRLCEGSFYEYPEYSRAVNSQSVPRSVYKKTADSFVAILKDRACSSPRRAEAPGELAEPRKGSSFPGT